MNVLVLGSSLWIDAILNCTRSFTISLVVTAVLEYKFKAFIKSTGPISEPEVYDIKFLFVLLPGPNLLVPPIFTLASMFLVL